MKKHRLKVLKGLMKVWERIGSELSESQLEETSQNLYAARQKAIKVMEVAKKFGVKLMVRPLFEKMCDAERACDDAVEAIRDLEQRIDDAGREE